MTAAVDPTAKVEIDSAAATGGSRSPFGRFTRNPTVRITVFVIGFIWTLPTAGILISSFRQPNAIRGSGWWSVLAHPLEASQWTLQNYASVLADAGMGEAFINSILVTIPATVIPITIAAFAAYAFAWLRFPGKSILFATVVGLLVVPIQMTLVPLLRLYGDLGLTGNFLGIWLAHTGFGLPLAIYLLYNYIATLPHEIIESAAVDGASPFTTFTRLVLPLSFPALAAFAIFQFLWVWNDLLVALVFLGTGSQTAILTAQLNELVGSRGEDWHLLTAGAFVSMVVPLIVFFALQRYFVRGLLAGSVKA
jgi:alpha-glucoside transport system permease protein